MKKLDIINAYCRIRTIDQTIPDDVLDFMKNSAIAKLSDDDSLSFEEIFDEPGMYVADSFAPGVCFEIQEDGVCFLKTYKDKDDINPLKENALLYNGLFQKRYKKVFTRQSLFK